MKNIDKYLKDYFKSYNINKGGGTTPAGKPVEAPKPKKKEGDEFKEKPAQW